VRGAGGVEVAADDAGLAAAIQGGPGKLTARCRNRRRPGPEADAQAFAQQSTPLLATVQLPPPSRVVGFEVTDYVVT